MPKLGPKKIAKSKLRKRLNCTVDQTTLKLFQKAAKEVVKSGKYSSVSRVVDVALESFVNSKA